MKVKMFDGANSYHPSVMYWYDGPLLWYGPVEGGGLALALNYEQTDTNLLFMVVRVTPRRLAAIRSSSITLHEAFRFPEDGQRYAMAMTAGWMQCDPWTDELYENLPRPGTRLRPRQYYKPRTRRDKYSKRKSQKP